MCMFDMFLFKKKGIFIYLFFFFLSFQVDLEKGTNAFGNFSSKSLNALFPSQDIIRKQ